MITVYGIKNCDTCRAARKWLTEQGIEHRFRDFREDGLDKARISGWVKALGTDALVNRRSTTWRQLSEAERKRADSDPAALLAANPTLIKRPVIEAEGERFVGFTNATREALSAAVC